MTVKIVAIGGGHGLSATLRAAATITPHVTAVVSVADDGGSSGRLRDEFQILPPGDLRMALTALAPDSVARSLWAHRFDGDGPLSGHSLGNLMLTALWQRVGVLEGLQQAAEALGCVGHVLPASLDPHHLSAVVVNDTGEHEEILGQAAIAAGGRQVLSLHTAPAQVSATPDVLREIHNADVVLVGPGSWYTSVMAPLIVDGVAAAIARTSAKVVLIANLMRAHATGGDKETGLFGLHDYLRSWEQLVPEVRLDAVICDEADAPAANEVRDVPICSAVLTDAGAAGHSPKRLAQTLLGWLSAPSTAPA